MGRAALAYRDFRRQYHEGDSAALDSWCASFSGCADHARLFRTSTSPIPGSPIVWHAA